MRAFTAACALIRSIAFMAFCTGSGAIPADDDLPDANDLAEATSHRFPQPVHVRELIGRRVLEPLESQPTLGFVRDVVSEPDGTIAVVMDYGGFFGFFSRPIAVPVNAMVLLGQAMEVTEYEPAQLDKFPNFVPAGTTPLSPNSVIRVGLGKPAH